MICLSHAHSANDIDNAQSVLLEVDSTADLPSIERKDLVRRVLDFANTGLPKGLPGAREMIHGTERFLVMTPEQDAQHVELQADLGAIVKGELSGPAIARLRKKARHVIVRSYAIDRRGVVAPRERHFVRNLEPLIADVLLWIRGDTQLAKDIKRCRLPGCGRFFFASDLVSEPSAKGRRRHRYCSDEHMQQGQTPGAKRTAKYRAKKLK